MQKLKTKLKSNSAFILLLLGNVLFFAKKMLFFAQKHSDISKIGGVLVLKGIFSETTYVCLLIYQILSFYNNSDE